LPGPFLFTLINFVLEMLVAEVSKEVVKQDEGGIIFGDGPYAGGNCWVASCYCGQLFVFEGVFVDGVLGFGDGGGGFYG